MVFKKGHKFEIVSKFPSGKAIFENLDSFPKMEKVITLCKDVRETVLLRIRTYAVTKGSNG